MTASEPATEAGVTAPAIAMDRFTTGTPTFDSVTRASVSPASYLSGEIGVQTSENIGRARSLSSDPSMAEHTSIWNLASSDEAAPCCTCLEVYAIATRNS